MSYGVSSVLWSIGGLVIGFVVGMVYCHARRTPHAGPPPPEPEHVELVVDDDGVPLALPLVRRNPDTGEPEVVQHVEVRRETFVRPSPIPRSLTIILIVMGALTLGLTVAGVESRASDLHRLSVINCQVIAQNFVRVRAEAADQQVLGDAAATILREPHDPAAVRAALGRLLASTRHAQQNAVAPPALPANLLADCRDGRLDSVSNPSPSPSR